uniref:hypothetical protein n=1 Tax=Escherichia coli TaxID=562 RepID=UPI00202CC96D|nr:hypothetical protein [Escherichia coli]
MSDTQGEIPLLFLVSIKYIPYVQMASVSNFLCGYRFSGYGIAGISSSRDDSP